MTPYTEEKNNLRDQSETMEIRKKCYIPNTWKKRTLKQEFCNKQKDPLRTGETKANEGKPREDDPSRPGERNG